MPKNESIVYLPVHDLSFNRFGDHVNPPISPSDLQALRSSIERQGILTPLVVWGHGGKNVVVAGNNRLRIARELKLDTVPVVIRHFENQTDAKIFAIIDNSARRHMITAQRAELALELQKLLTVGQGRRTDRLEQPSSKMKEVDAWKQAAKLAGVSVGAVSGMKKVIESGDKSLIEKVRAGSVKVSAAACVLREQTRAEPTQRPPVVPEEQVMTCYQGSPDELVAHVTHLYLREGSRVADVTYGEGHFWRSLDTSKYDFHPSDIATTERKEDFRKLTYEAGSFDVVVFDPPFLAISKGMPYTTGIRYRNQHNECRKYEDVLDLYRQGMKECHRVLRNSGTLWVKCQDAQESGRQIMTHIFVHDYAVKLGMSVCDLFIQHRVQQGIMKSPVQRFARKNHSYLWVFAK